MWRSYNKINLAWLHLLLFPELRNYFIFPKVISLKSESVFRFRTVFKYIALQQLAKVVIIKPKKLTDNTPSCYHSQRSYHINKTENREGRWLSIGCFNRHLSVYLASRTLLQDHHKLIQVRESTDVRSLGAVINCCNLVCRHSLVPHHPIGCHSRLDQFVPKDHYLYHYYKWLGNFSYNYVSMSVVTNNIFKHHLRYLDFSICNW